LYAKSPVPVPRIALELELEDDFEAEEGEAGKNVVILYVPLATWLTADGLVGTAMVVMEPQTSV
jgi:hypothetical protein